MNIVKKYIMFAAGLLTFGLMSCDEEQEINLNVGAVTTFLTPANDTVITLSPTESTTFSWEPTQAEDGGVVIYEVLFDKEGGDFTNPCYKLPSDNGGAKTTATVTHKLLNSIADSAKIEFASTGKIIWTVRSSKGLGGHTSEKVNTMTVTRLQGFEVIPANLYISGTGIEQPKAGDKFTFNKGRNYKDVVDNSVFEIFAQLKTGDINIKDSNGKGYVINFDDKTVRLSNANTAIPASMNDKVYRIRLDFSTCKAAVTEIKEIKYQQVGKNYNATPSVYQGNGNWLIAGCPLIDGDNRYKFLVTTEPLGDIISFCATWESGSAEPGDYIGSNAYQYLRQVSDAEKINVQEGSRPWDEYTACYKYMSADKGKTADITIHMNADFAHYTHSLVIK